MSTIDERIASLEMGLAVSNAEMKHVVAGQERLEESMKGISKKIDDIAATVMQATAVGKAGWAISGGLGKVVWGFVTAVAGGLLTLFGGRYMGR